MATATHTLPGTTTAEFEIVIHGRKLSLEITGYKDPPDLDSNYGGSDWHFIRLEIDGVPLEVKAKTTVSSDTIDNLSNKMMDILELEIKAKQ